MTWILPIFEILILNWLAPVFWLGFLGSLFMQIVRCTRNV